MISSEYALLIIDTQQGLFHSPISPYQADALLANVYLLIKKARQAEVPALFICYTGPDDSPLSAQSPLAQLLSEVGISGERDIASIKRCPSCFQRTDLAYRLAQVDVKQLVIAGMKTEFCVGTAYRAASTLGWRTVLISDTYSTMDSERLSAPGIVDHHGITLAGLFASPSTAAEWYFSAEE